MQRIMVVLMPIENKSLQGFLKARPYSCRVLPLDGSTSKHGVQ
jgi:hypothetical protein